MTVFITLVMGAGWLTAPPLRKPLTQTVGSSCVISQCWCCEQQQWHPNTVPTHNTPICEHPDFFRNDILTHKM